jgi:hypothetical protein
MLGYDVDRGMTTSDPHLLRDLPEPPNLAGGLGRATRQGVTCPLEPSAQMTELPARRITRRVGALLSFTSLHGDLAVRFCGGVSTDRDDLYFPGMVDVSP